MKVENIQKDIYFRYVNKRSNEDLYVVAFGHEKCSPQKEALGDMQKNHFMFHYILNGEGDFKLGDRLFHLGKNQMFVTYPGLDYYYKQDYNNPWEYIWMEFSGIRASELIYKSLFSIENPVYQCFDPKVVDSLKDLLDCPENEVSLELHSLSHLYKFISLLINERNPKITQDTSKRDIHINLAIKYIENNYSDSDLSLIAISKSLHINPSYLSRIFKELTGTTISKFIIDLRMQKASELLEKRSYSIKDIAYMVGYSDSHFFSNEFKKHRGISPKRYEVEGSYVQENRGENPDE